MTGLIDDDPFTSDPAEGFDEALKQLYRDLRDEIARLAPVCDLSGRCCRFKEYDHTLFLSKPEADYLVSNAPRPSRALDQGATCPWQDDRGLCQARDARPLGCRLFYCDPSYQDVMPVLSETYLSKLKQLTAKFGLPWNYAPLHVHLAQFTLPAADRADRVDVSTADRFVSADSPVVT